MSTLYQASRGIQAAYDCPNGGLHDCLLASLDTYVAVQQNQVTEGTQLMSISQTHSYRPVMDGLRCLAVVSQHSECT
ncbi:hypothetical protein C9427_28055 [Mesorhizobium helmanticense]|uniref:Uncharacterized protein n=1 Tax=Mesorhizobium helmanticense TaxID=1776423 RepID=A0A2T4ING6_9HYPH|nr:hypothetical protein C9427_28055 [Mesorhizobium helmanticense]